MKLLEVLYDFLSWGVHLPAKLLASRKLRGEGKLSAGLQMRAKKPWLSQKAPSRPIWFHASSGELEYARPILRLLQDSYPRTPTLLTYFSPSARRILERVPQVQLAFPSPWDTKKDVREFLQFHQPQALLIARSDLWPHMIRETARAGIPSLMFSTTVTPRHRKGLKGLWYRTWLPYLTEIWGVSEEDARQLQAMNLQGPTLRSRGDTRYDQVRDRLIGPIAPFWRLEPKTKPLIVLGSMWPEDEKIWLQSLPGLLKTFQLVWVPHETDPSHLNTLKESFKAKAVPFVMSQQRTPPQPGEVLIVDEVGVLAFLYKAADIAFVGGSFKGKVHSVMEALGAGRPVLTGPFIQNNREALDFGQIPLSPESDLKMVQPVRSAEELQKLLPSYLPLLGPSLEKRILAEFNRRLGASLHVVDWLEQSVRLL